jgi:hypothetical protein
MEENMAQLARFMLAALLLAASACASVPMAPDNIDAYAKSFIPPPPDRAHIYVYRNESMGGGVKFDMRLDGQPAGTTVGKTFALLPVRPGQHLLTSGAENTSELPLVAQPGQILFVWQEAKMGVLYARNKLQLVDPGFAIPGVRECKLIAFPPPPLPPLPPQQPPVMPPQPPAMPPQPPAMPPQPPAGPSS